MAVQYNIEMLAEHVLQQYFSDYNLELHNAMASMRNLKPLIDKQRDESEEKRYKNNLRTFLQSVDKMRVLDTEPKNIIFEWWVDIVSKNLSGEDLWQKYKNTHQAELQEIEAFREENHL